MSRVSIKMCDINYGKVGEQAISEILPTLLKTGLGSQVEEVRAVRYRVYSLKRGIVDCALY